MPTYKLKDLVEEVISGEWGQEVLNGTSGVKVIRTTNFSNTGKLDLSKEIVLRDIDADKVEKKKLLVGDIVIEKSGGSPEQPVGRVIYFDQDDDVYLCNNFTSVLRPNKELVIPKYFMYLMFNLHRTRKVLKFQNKTTGIINLKLDQYLNQTKVIVPSIDIQMKTVKVLDQTFEIINKRQSQIVALDELTQSVFLEMFGDPVYNPNNLEKARLGDLIDVIGGYAFKSKDFIDDGIPVIKIGTANKGYFDLNTLAFLPKDYGEKYENYLIVPGDLLITLTGTVGKDDYANICEVTDDYSSYLLNQRVAKLKINSDINKQYLLYCFKQKKFKEQLTKVSRGVRQANISNDDIKKLLIPYPTLKEQEIFAEIAIKVKEQKKKLIKSQKDMEILYKSLLQRAFKGELFQNQE